MFTARSHALAVLLALAPFAGCLGADQDGAPVETNASNDMLAVQAFGGPEPRDNASEDPAAPPLAASWTLTGFEGAEPSLGSTSDGSLFVTAFSDALRSRDGGATWEVVDTYASDLGSPTWDPFLHVDPLTDRVYTDHLNELGVCTTVGWSEDAGDTWNERDLACAAPIVDFQKLGSGPPGPEDNPFVGAHPSVLYLCYNKPVTLPASILLSAVGAGLPAFYVATHCSMSYDGGASWPLERQVWGCALVFSPAGVLAAGAECGGAAGQPVVSPDGVVVVPDTNGDRIHLGVSRDSGLTWTSVAGPPRSAGWSAAAEAGFAPDGTLFVMWQDLNGTSLLARTSDLGESWAGPWRVTPPGIDTNVFNALVVGDGRVAMAFLGTDSGKTADDAGDETRWHLFIVTSDDAFAATPAFAAVQVTPDEDPVQIGRICLNGIGCEGSRNLLDFIDATATPDGRIFVAYADGCTAACAGVPDATSGDSRAQDLAIAWLQGWTLA